MAAHDMYETGATLEEVGLAFGITRERVRQIFSTYDLPVRSVQAAATLKRTLQLQENMEAIQKSFSALHDVDAVCAELDLPKAVVRAAVFETFTPSERRKIKAAPKKYTNDELIGFLRETSSILGGVLSAQAYTDYSRKRHTPDGRPWPTHQTHFLRFGSWRKALGAAGLAANPSSPITGQMVFEDSHCIDAIRAAARSLGRPPTVQDYDTFARNSGGAMPSAATVRHRLGRWSQALTLAGV